DARAGTAAAVVEIDDRAIEGEGLLNLAPVSFVGRDVGRRPPLDRPGGRCDADEAVVGERRECSAPGDAGGSKERAACDHLVLHPAASAARLPGCAENTVFQ